MVTHRALKQINVMSFLFTTRKLLNTDGQNMSLKCKYSVTKHAKDGFDAVGNFLVSELLQTDKIYL
jgi:hypothetical protein